MAKVYKQLSGTKNVTLKNGKHRTYMKNAAGKSVCIGGSGGIPKRRKK